VPYRSYLFGWIRPLAKLMLSRRCLLDRMNEMTLLLLCILVMYILSALMEGLGAMASEFSITFLSRTVLAFGLWFLEWITVSC
jgi:hypothetical protein